MNPFRASIIFFILLELIHLPGVCILDSMKIIGPSDIKDILLLPTFLTFNFFLLFLIKWKIKKGIVFGIFHVIFWSTILFIDSITEGNKNCIDCEPAEFFLETFNGCICSFFALLNHLVYDSLAPAQFRYIFATYGINMVLMALYLMSIINISLFIEKKIIKNLVNKH